MTEQVQKQNQHILYDSSNGIATIALNRPEAANAQNLALLYQVWLNNTALKVRDLQFYMLTVLH